MTDSTQTTTSTTATVAEPARQFTLAQFIEGRAKYYGLMEGKAFNEEWATRRYADYLATGYIPDFMWR